MFKVGDIVEAFGVRGKVVSIDGAFRRFPISVSFINDIECSYTIDGLQSEWHKTPSLILISRSKKLISKTYYTIVFKGVSYVAGFLYETKQMCIDSLPDDIKNVQIVPITIEVEE